MYILCAMVSLFRFRSFIKRDGPIAQFRLERTPDKREVSGSSPLRPTERCVRVGMGI